MRGIGSESSLNHQAGQDTQVAVDRSTRAGRAELVTALVHYAS